MKWLPTLWALGPINLWRVVSYRAGVRLGFNPVRRLRGAVPVGPFFSPVMVTTSLPASTHWRTECRYFGWMERPLTSEVPEWFVHPVSGERVKTADTPWWQISDFDPAAGDIKGIWELSRFDWVLAFAQQAAIGDADALTRLNNWLEDWCVHNPPYVGPNWKCGQEASIRVMHLAMTACILQQHTSPTPGLLDLVRLHLARIAPTLRYALAQDNNHGTSEAAALFIGGTWLVSQGMSSNAVGWAKSGRRFLEERVLRLVESDGSFSQYSVAYHRLLLDTLCMVEVWRQKLKLQPFSESWQSRAKATAFWLRAFTHPVTGDAPNLGANDGARLLPLVDIDYRDFRPSVQLGCVLFAQARAFSNDGIWNLPLAWLGIPLPDALLPDETSRLFDNGGYAVLRRNDAQVFVSYPRYRFRPGHADALHVDVWVHGRNVLRDAGSYSYNADPHWLSYFPGTCSHNTVQFDGRDQMLRLTRFLFGNWLKTTGQSELYETDQEVSFAVAYQDYQGVCHHRSVMLGTEKMQVVDQVSGFWNRAVLRWRFNPGNWLWNGAAVTDGKCTMTVQVEGTTPRLRFVEGWESRYYLQRTSLPVLEVEIVEPAKLTTSFTWKS